MFVGKIASTISSDQLETISLLIEKRSEKFFGTKVQFLFDSEKE